MMQPLFFINAVESRLSIKDFELPKDGSTSQKLNVLEQAMCFPKGSKLIIGDFNPRKTRFLFSDKVAGNNQYALGFVADEKTEGTYYVPNTLLRGDTNDYICQPYSAVVAIFVKNSNEDKYSELTYQSKATQKTGLHKLSLPKHIKAKIIPYLEQCAINKQDEKAKIAVAGATYVTPTSGSTVASAEEAAPTKYLTQEELVAVTVEQCSQKLNAEILEEEA